ncbi:chemotaxis protein CheY [Vibrio sp. qd031]|uniref:response regulator n=1 Tax=Vibrio sp. qd031 TaxID=1603038 RepID=UPI000A23AB3B|nr:response regulator transcription factor [Vibrio sp. qd031]ORT49310.1 chemotaxis protein CheY [Vibrio sp. qd031]
MTNRILVVDDDQEIGVLLKEYFEQAGYHLDVAEDGDALEAYWASHSEPDLVLLDVMLPGDDGFELCRKLRARSNVPIIMLTAVSDEMDQIVGLELGADDYVAKPFNPRQLMARVKALLRRTKASRDAGHEGPPSFYYFGDWKLETLSHRLIHQVDQTMVDLSGSDFALLLLFLQHPNQVLDKDTITRQTKGRESLPFERGLDVQLSRLRQRLGSSEETPVYIKTIRGNGYLFTASVDAQHS